MALGGAYRQALARGIDRFVPVPRIVPANMLPFNFL